MHNFISIFKATEQVNSFTHFKEFQSILHREGHDRRTHNGTRELVYQQERPWGFWLRKTLSHLLISHIFQTHIKKTLRNVAGTVGMGKYLKKSFISRNESVSI
jgi:hypothetical protein